jgi:hypothetical protein
MGRRDIKKENKRLTSTLFATPPNDGALPIPVTPCFGIGSSGKEEAAPRGRSQPFPFVSKGRMNQMKRYKKKDNLLSSTIITEHSPNFLKNHPCQIERIQWLPRTLANRQESRK